MERHTTPTRHWQAGTVTSSSQRCDRFVLCQCLPMFANVCSLPMFLGGEDFYFQEGMAMRYNTWNLGGSAGGKEMEMVDTVPNVPKVGCSTFEFETIHNFFSRAQW